MTPRSDPHTEAPGAALIRGVLELVASEDFRLNGCACNANGECYFHKHKLPEALAALAALESERDALSVEADGLREQLYADELVHQRMVAAEARVPQLAEALTDECELSGQTVETIRNLRANWKTVIDEDIEGEPLIENILYWLIEDEKALNDARIAALGVVADGGGGQ